VEMSRRTFLALGLLGMAGMSGCDSGGNSALQQGQSRESGFDFHRNVILRSEYRDPADLIDVQTQINSDGDVLCCLLHRERDSRSSNFTAKVVLDRLDQGSKVLALHEGAGRGLAQYRDPCLDNTGDYWSWIEEVGQTNQISYQSPEGKLAVWRAPTGSRFVRNLGLDREGGELRLYAICESRGRSSLLRGDHTTGVVAAYVLNGIRPGTLDMKFERRCRYGLGVASDGLNQQFFYLNNGSMPTVQVLENEPVQTFALNSAGEVSYLKTDGSLLFLQGKGGRAVQGVAAIDPSLSNSSSLESAGQVKATVATGVPLADLTQLYRLERSDFGLLLDDIRKITIQSLSSLGLTILYAPETDAGLAVSVDGRPRDVFWRQYWKEGYFVRSLSAAGPFHCATLIGKAGSSSDLEIIRFRMA
jgi:hypothetical protein